MESEAEYRKYDVAERTSKEIGSAKREFEKYLLDDSGSDSSSVDEEYEVSSLLSSIDDQLTWRGRMQVVLHSTAFHLFIIALVVLDSLIVLFEFLLDVGAFGNAKCQGGNFLQQAEFCHFDNATRRMCRPHAQLILEGLQLTEGDGKTGLCVCGYRSGSKVCVTMDEDEGINPAAILHFCSLAILSLFLVELMLKLIAFRLKLFTHKFEVFDATVVTLSWILDVASEAKEEAFNAASLLIILRLWRIVRIVNGVLLSAKTRSDKKFHTAQSTTRKVIHAYHKCQEKLEHSQKEISKLKDFINESGLEPPITSASKESGNLKVDVKVLEPGKQYLLEKMELVTFK